ARLELNGAIENEINANNNETTGTAQMLTGFVGLGGGADRGLVRGQTETGLTSLISEVEANDSTATANDVTGDFVATGTSIYQMTINGTLSSTSDTDYFSLGLMQIGDVITIAMSGTDGGRGTTVDPMLTLYRGGTTSAATSNDDRATNNFDALI